MTIELSIKDRTNERETDMYSTLDFELDNGKTGDYREKLYVRLTKSTHQYSYHIAWENSGDGFDYADNGETKEIGNDSCDWWRNTIESAILTMIYEQTPIEDNDEYVDGEGKWMLGFEKGWFADDKWTDRTN